MIRHRCTDVDDASSSFLNQHLFNRELGDEKKTFDVHGTERPQILDSVIGKGLDKNMPALFTSASIEPNLLVASSTIFAAVAASAMLPSTNASLSDISNALDLLMFREFATTLQPRPRKAFTRPAPLPCEPPVTMTVFAFTYCRVRP